MAPDIVVISHASRHAAYTAVFTSLYLLSHKKTTGMTICFKVNDDGEW